MGDFILDLRDSDTRIGKQAADMLVFFHDCSVFTKSNRQFFFIQTKPDNPELWAPFEAPTDLTYVAIAGRVTFSELEWKEAAGQAGQGGLASKAVYQMYSRGGIRALGELNGSYVVFVHDPRLKKAYLVTDRCGMFPCFASSKGNSLPVIGSHPDVLARVVCASEELDMVSLAEFLVAGKVSFPYSYYMHIRSLDFGSIHEFELETKEPAYVQKTKHFEFTHRIDSRVSEDELADELARAFVAAVNRRTLPIFGQTGISLSGGLDSRALLCSAQAKNSIWSFCFFDEPNLEYRIAEEVAGAVGVKFIPFRRTFDHYADNAELGVRIAGGMGDFGNNHYLGFRESLKDSGIENIIAGFYCDYLFKSLVLNKSFNKLLRTERFSDFRYDNYMPLYWFDTRYSQEVKARLDTLIPDDLKKDDSDEGLLEIEKKRLFPFCYEPDNQETTIPQRVMGWFLPTVDNDILDVYLRTPPRFKLNTSMYSKMVEILCGDEVSRIMNVNTGARVNADRMSIIFFGLKRALERRLVKKKMGIATDESWPNWKYYILKSPKIRELWHRKCSKAEDILGEILGMSPYSTSIEQYADQRLKLFLRLLTLKLWIEHVETF